MKNDPKTKKPEIKRKPRKDFYTIVNDVDGNDSFTVRASDGNEAAHRALETLGWWVAKPF